LMTVLSTTFFLSLAPMLVPTFYVGLGSVRQERATARPKVMELALFTEVPGRRVLGSRYTGFCINVLLGPSGS
jgi:hypothetical protein